MSYALIYSGHYTDQDTLYRCPNLPPSLGMTLTQIYSQYVEVSECYEKEKQEREQVSLRRTSS